MTRYVLALFCLLSLTASSQCSQPFGSAANPSGSSVTISWSKRTCANGYNIRYRALGSFLWKYKTVADTNQTTIYFINYSTDYQFAVASISGGVTSVYSFNKTFRTLCECMEPIVVIDSIGANGVKFYMDDDSCGVGFRIQYRIVGANAWNTLTVRDTAQTLISPNLNRNTTYEYRSRRDCKLDGSYQSKWNKTWEFTTLSAMRRIKYMKLITMRQYDRR
jgi:hypothetical protein